LGRDAVARDPRKNPAVGDVIEFRVTPASKHVGRFNVKAVTGDEVFYWDEGLIDHVSIWKWRKWFVNKPDVRVRPATSAPVGA
jgi:hypothetical protein